MRLQKKKGRALRGLFGTLPTLVVSRETIGVVRLSWELPALGPPVSGSPQASVPLQRLQELQHPTACYTNPPPLS